MKEDDVKNEQLKEVIECDYRSPPLFGVVACAVSDSKSEKQLVALLEHRLGKLKSEIDVMITSLDGVRFGGTLG